MPTRGSIRLKIVTMTLGMSAALVAGAVNFAAGPVGAAPATGSPLTFGVVGTQTGPSAAVEQGQAMQAYVDNWNAHGGYKGHRISLIIEDGANSPTQTAAAARQLVSHDNVIGMVQNYELNDCPTNTQFYQSTGIGVVDAESSASCYNPAVDFTTEKLGGSIGVSTIVAWGVTQGAKRFALLVPSIPGIDQLTNALTAYAKKVHRSMLIVHGLISPTAADLDAEIAQMKAAHIDTVIPLLGTEALAIQESNTQSFGPQQGIRWVFPTASGAAAATLPGAYQLITGYPWTSSNPQIVAARRILTKAGVKLDTLAGEGYQAAAALQSTLDTIKGSITRASFLDALRHDTKVPLALTPLITDPPHPTLNPTGGLIQKSEHGAWVLISPFLVVHE